MGVKLSVYHINSLIRKLQAVGGPDGAIRAAKYDIVDELVNEGVERAKILNGQATRSGLTESTIFGRRGIREKGGTIRGMVTMQGPHAIFEEFGTGEVGKTDPHPQAGSLSFSVPPYTGYITGSFVSSHINKYGRHYWFNRPMGKSGQNDYFASNGYTEGIPSGKQMFNTVKYLNKIKHKVAVKHLNDTIQEINKAINEFE